LKGICELYKIETELRESHIFPKFVVNYHKKTGSKYFRKPLEPNKRFQDGVKLYLLSDKAEQEFSAKETWFANNIFYPFHKGQRKLNYTNDMYYFAISFLWRALVLNLKSDDLSNRWYYEKLMTAEKEWREFLINDKYPKTCNNNFLYFTHYVGENTTNIEKVYSYLLRTMDATIVCSPENQDTLIIYAKFNQFMFWSILKDNSTNFPPMDCFISPIGGTFNIPQSFDYQTLNGFLGNRIKGINSLDKPSEIQEKKILDEIMKNPIEWLNSDAGKSIIGYEEK